jgi:hypothetical protein
VVLRIARDDDSLRMAMLVVVADEDGDAMFVMMGMYGHTDIVRVALFDGGALRVELGVDSRVRRNKGYLECNLGKDSGPGDVDEGYGREERGEVRGEMHVGEEEMGVRCTREEERVVQRRLERQRQGTGTKRKRGANQSL